MMIGENTPWAHKGYYDKPIPVIKVGPRRFRFTEDCEIFGVVIKKDYEVDGASVPRPFWFVLSPFTEGFRASVVHDWRHTHDMQEGTMTRKEADGEFYHNLRKCKLNRVRATLSWLGVRGWAHFRGMT